MKPDFLSLPHYFQVMDALVMEFEDNTFDLVWAVQVEHIRLTLG